ncbi:MAG: ABC-3 protein, partial [Halothiobacillaceae bacterium]
LVPMAVLTAVLLALWFGVRDRLGVVGFYTMFAVMVTASVQLVGIYLVFASLIIPALASRSHLLHRQLIIGYSVGVLGYASGLVLSAVFDLPSGAVVVWTLAGCGILLASCNEGHCRHRVSGDHKE